MAGLLGSLTVFILCVLTLIFSVLKMLMLILDFALTLQTQFLNALPFST